MKILYDHQAFTGTTHSGISRYFAEIIAEIQQLKGRNTDVSVVFSNNHHLQNIKNNRLFAISQIGPLRLMTTLASQLNKLNSLKAIFKGSFDIFHPTYFHRYFINNIKKPFVITFHDTSAEDYPEYAELGGDFELRKALLEKASRVIAISECTKSDLLRHYKISSDKIDVIYHATRFDALSPKKIESLPEKYVLFVGQRRFYKNFNDFLLKATDFLKTHRLPLICIGGGDFNAEELEIIKNLGLETLVQKHQADSDESLLYAYQRALCFVYPSMLEGFGIPILEAFAARCPMILSDIPVFREVAQNAALFYDLKNKLSLETALESFLDENKRNEFVEKGTERLKDFSWKKSAIQTLETYQKAIAD